MADGNSYEECDCCGDDIYPKATICPACPLLRFCGVECLELHTDKEHLT